VTTLTVLLLVGLWAAVLVPGAWRDRRNSPRSTVDGFHAAMQRLATCDDRRVLVYGGGPGREVHPARSARQDLLERRRMVLARLAGLVVTTFLTALVAGGWFWWSLSALAALACAGYVATLRALKVRRDRTREVVQLHPSQATQATHATHATHATQATQATQATHVAQRARAAARRMLQDAATASAERSRAMDDRSRAREVG